MNNQPALSINLIKKKGTPSIDVLIHWAITGGRFLVILTETIALAAFLYRFTIDRQIIDLHDKIKAKQIVVDALKEQETSYRELQERILQVKQISENITYTPDFFGRIAALATKNNLTIKSLSVTDKTIHIEITAGNATNLKTFITQLQTQKELKDISIDRIENRSTVAQIAAVISGETDFPLKKIVGLPINKEKK